MYYFETFIDYFISNNSIITAWPKDIILETHFFAYNAKVVCVPVLLLYQEVYQQIVYRLTLSIFLFLGNFRLAIYSASSHRTKCSYYTRYASSLFPQAFTAIEHRILSSRRWIHEQRSKWEWNFEVNFYAPWIILRYWRS
jgi:hypothetical protein